LRHGKRTDTLRSLGAGDVCGFDDGPSGRTAGAHDDAGADVGDFLWAQAGVLDRLFHRDVIPRSTLPEEAHRTAVDHRRRIERRRTRYLRPETQLGIFLGPRNARLRLVEACKHFLGVVSDRRDDTHPGDHNPPHDSLALLVVFLLVLLVVMVVFT